MFSDPEGHQSTISASIHEISRPTFSSQSDGSTESSRMSSVRARAQHEKNRSQAFRTSAKQQRYVIRSKNNNAANCRAYQASEKGKMITRILLAKRKAEAMWLKYMERVRGTFREIKYKELSDIGLSPIHYIKSVIMPWIQEAYDSNIDDNTCIRRLQLEVADVLSRSSQQPHMTEREAQAIWASSIEKVLELLCGMRDRGNRMSEANDMHQQLSILYETNVTNDISSAYFTRELQSDGVDENVENAWKDIERNYNSEIGAILEARSAWLRQEIKKLLMRQGYPTSPKNINHKT